jgi:hypothetical protein
MAVAPVEWEAERAFEELAGWPNGSAPVIPMRPFCPLG